MSKHFASSEDLISQVTIYTKYAKYNDSIKRRSNWTELVDEVANMHKRRHPKLVDEIDAAFRYVHDKKVIPSMRSMQFAGQAIELGESRIYNCAYLPIDDRIAFREVMFLLMGGTGVGYSVQRHHVAKLPSIKLPDSAQRFIIGDSIEGWSDAVNRLCRAYFDGRTRPIFDYRDIRPKGSPLKKSGGKAPGPDKLKIALENIEAIFKQAINRKLKTIEVHDIVCHLASCVVSGGVRDSAMISLFSPDDDDMLNAKGYIYVDIESIGQNGVTVRPDVFKNTAGGISSNTYGNGPFLLKMSDTELEKLLTEKKLPWWHFHPQRGKANNSALLLRSDIGREDFMHLWARTKASDAGEPGCYWSNDKNTGTNPCGEIALQEFQFCNLTSVNAANVVDQADFNARVKAAAFIGTLQASYTDFHYLRPIWRETTEREALLGVSLTGIAYGRLDDLDLSQAAIVATTENHRVASLLGIKRAARVTTIKPEGSGSLALGVLGAGIHAIHDRYFIRRIRFNKNDRLYDYLKVMVPNLVEIDQFDSDKAIISLPIKAPPNGKFRDETALEFLERVKKYYTEWVRPGHRRGANAHNVSATINIKPHEWDEVGEWMWENRSYYNGLSCLPYDGGTYVQAPYESISEERYNELASQLQKINLEDVTEDDDFTNRINELACAGGACLI